MMWARKIEYKEIKPNKFIKNKIENIKKNNNIDLQAKLQENKNNKKEELIEQNNNSNINILNLNKINCKGHITDKKFNKEFSKEYIFEKNPVFFQKKKTKK